MDEYAAHVASFEKQDAAARDQDEPQQRLDHVGVHHVRRAAQQWSDDDIDPVGLEVQPEVRCAPAEVLIVGNE